MDPESPINKCTTFVQKPPLSTFKGLGIVLINLIECLVFSVLILCLKLSAEFMNAIENVILYSILLLSCNCPLKI
jgi:hypothetical protein